MKNILNDAIDKYAQSICLIDGDTKVSLCFSEINELTSKVAAYIERRYGISKIQKVLIAYENSIEFAIIFHALLKLKAIPMPISSELTLYEYIQYISFINPDWIWCDRIEVFEILSGNYKNVIAPMEYSFMLQLKKCASKFFYYPEYSDDELGVVVFTSGTNANPKGVMLKYNGLLGALKECVSKFKIHKKTRIFQVMPFYHAEGCFTTMILPWLSGASIVFIGNLDIKKITNYWRYVYENKANYLIVLPTLLQTLLDIYRESNKEYFIAQYAKCGSSFLSEETRRKFEEKFHIKIIDVYGSTEANAISVGDIYSSSYDYSVGDLTHIADVKVSNENEIMVKNSKWFMGYLNAPDLTASVFDGIWYRTGDIGEIRNNKVFLWGRKDDIINRNGFKISPQEINDVFQKDEFVLDSFTIGLKDQRMNDSIIVFVVLKNVTKENVENIQKRLFMRCQENLATYKLPDRILFVNEILLNSIGKPSKKLMGDMYKKSVAYKCMDILYLDVF